MDEKMKLNDGQLSKVSGGAGETYDQSGRKCSKCGSTNILFLGEQGDCGKFQCADCGETFFGDV